MAHADKPPPFLDDIEKNTLNEPLSRRAAVIWAWLSLGAAVYLTLLPFEFSNLSLERAWDVYRNMNLAGPTLKGRQQFMANVLMFMPLGFFWSAWLTYGRQGRLRTILAFLLVAMLGLAVTMTVEFLQVWLPFRHPAGEDILGNFTGAVAGSFVWFALRTRLSLWRAGLSKLGPEALHIALIGYAVAYIVTVLLPFDFVLSQAEFLAHLDATNWGWWTAPGACTGGLRCISWQGLEVVAAVPLGLLLGQILRRRSVRYWRAGIPLAVVLALAVELLNLFTLSGTAEGQSLMLRCLGLIAGLALPGRLPANPNVLIGTLQRHVMWLLLLGIPPYLVLLLGLNHGFGPYDGSVADAWQQLQNLRLWPFYYHYHVSEVVALRSTALHLAMYLPIGLFIWLWHVRQPLSQGRMNAYAAVAAALTALAMEAGKLFITGARPDPASLILASVAAMTGAAACRWLATIATAPSPERPGLKHTHTSMEMTTHPPVIAAQSDHPQASLGIRVRKFMAVSLAGVTLGLASTWPVLPAFLTLALASYGALLWWRPQAWLMVIPALIPLLDFSLWTGNLHLDELDLFILITLAFGLWRDATPSFTPLLPPRVKWALGLLVGSTAIAVIIALLLEPRWDPAQVHHYTNPWNALRVAKGLLWATLLFAMIRRSPLSPQLQLERWFLPGAGLGLTATLLFVLWERATYPGLFNFDSSYRISGLFTDMRVGGPTIETYLVLALPLGLAWIFQQRLVPGVLGALLLGSVGTYSLWVTYSRGGYVGLVVALAVVVGLALLITLRKRHPRPGKLLLGAILPALIFIAVTAPMMQGFAEQRMGQLRQDFSSRIDHWRMALNLPAESLLAPILGRGLGTFPQAYGAGNPAGIVPANFTYTRADGPPRLRLGTGDSLFINQRLKLPQDLAYRVQVRARTEAPATFRLFICEKPVRHSFTCQSQVFSLAGGADWETLDWLPDVKKIRGSAGTIFKRGLVFSLTQTTAKENVIEFNQVTLTDSKGNQHLKNPNFAELGQHWYFTTDHLWPWRIENQWLEIYFDQGWLGVLAFSGLLLAGLGVLLRRALGGNITALSIIASLTGALVIGLFGTIFFAPRLALFFYLTLLLGIAGTSSYARKPTDAPEHVAHSP